MRPRIRTWNRTLVATTLATFVLLPALAEAAPREPAKRSSERGAAAAPRPQAAPPSSGSRAVAPRPAVRQQTTASSRQVRERTVRPRTPRPRIQRPVRERTLPRRLRPPRTVFIHPPRHFFFHPGHHFFYRSPYFWPGYSRGLYYAPAPAYATAPRAVEARGAIECAVRPRAAELWIDGTRVGRCEDFGGLPDYLWLEEGTYDVVLYREGYQTYATSVEVRAGRLVQVRARMRRGEAVTPEELFPEVPSPRDVRLDQRRARGERVAGDPDWQERARERRRQLREELGTVDEALEREPPLPPFTAPDPEVDEELEPEVVAEDAGALHLAVEPVDASVYLDGRFLGTGADLVGLREGVPAGAGTRRIEVVRPGYQPETVTLELEAGETLQLTIRLEPHD